MLAGWATAHTSITKFLYFHIKTFKYLKLPLKEDPDKGYIFYTWPGLLLCNFRGIAQPKSLHRRFENDFSDVGRCNDQPSPCLHIHFGHHVPIREAGDQVFKKPGQGIGDSSRRVRSHATDLLSWCKAPAVVIPHSPTAPSPQPTSVRQPSTGLNAGDGETLSYAIWLIIQAKMSKRYPHPYSSSALLNLFAAIQCTCVAAITDRDPSAFELRWDVNLLTIIYTGILVSGLAVALISWAIQMRGPLFVSAFNPLSLVIVAFFGSIFLDEALHLGSVLGAGLIILGLYTVLWGKGKGVKELVQLQAHRSAGEATKLDSDGLRSNPAGAGIGADQVPEQSNKEDQIDSVQLQLIESGACSSHSQFFHALRKSQH